jgi:hypothetical protein
VKTTQVAFGLRRSGSYFEAEPQRQFVSIETDIPMKRRTNRAFQKQQVCQSFAQAVK